MFLLHPSNALQFQMSLFELSPSTIFSLSNLFFYPICLLITHKIYLISPKVLSSYLFPYIHNLNHRLVFIYLVANIHIQMKIYHIYLSLSRLPFLGFFFQLYQFAFKFYIINSWAIFHCINVPHCCYPLFCCRTFKMFPVFPISLWQYEQSRNNHG